MVKCKDCKNYLLIQGYLKHTTEANPVTKSWRHRSYSLIRIAYCPTVEMVVDISTERECGHFEKQ